MGATFNLIYSLFYGKDNCETKTQRKCSHTSLMQWLLYLVCKGLTKIFRAAVIMEYSLGHSNHITKHYLIMDDI